MRPRLNLVLSDHLRSIGSRIRWYVDRRELCIATLASLSIVEVGNATRLAGDLFKRTFGATIPTSPRHFIIVRTDDRSNPALGYVHYARCGSGYLAGGLVVDAMRFRQLDAATAEAVRAQGGFGEWLMRATCESFDDADAVFALIGDRRSVALNTRVGFEKTPHPHLYVLWKRSSNQRQKVKLVDRVLAVGPF